MKASFKRIYIEKRRNIRRLICEYFSHMLIISIAIIGYFSSSITTYPERSYTLLKASIPDAFMRQDSTPKELFAEYNSIASGPLRIPDFDQYIRLGEYMKKRLSQGSNQQEKSVLTSTSFGNDLRNLLYPGVIGFCPKLPETYSLIEFLDRKYPKFRRLKRFVYKSEQAALNAMINPTSSSSNIFALVVLNKLNDYEIDYTIRMDNSLLPKTNSFLSSPAIGLDANFQKYFLSGFLTLQLGIDSYIFEKWMNISKHGYNSSMLSTEIETKTMTYKLRLQQQQQQQQQLQQQYHHCADGPPRSLLIPFPTKAYVINSFYEKFGFALGILLVISIFYPLTLFAKTVIQEREKKLFQMLLIMGLPERVYETSWLIAGAISLLWFAITSAILATNSFFPKSSVPLVMLLFVLFALAELMFCCFLISVCSSSRLASVLTPLCTFLALLPRFMFLTTTSSEAVIGKLLSSLLAPTCFIFGIDMIIQMEYAGVGMQFNDILDDSQFNFLIILMMLLLDSLLYGLMTILSKYVSSAYASSGQQSLAAALLTLTEDSPDLSEDPVSASIGKDINANSFEVIPIELRPHVKVFIRKLSKVFSSQFTAVDEISLSLLENQITCLLGHNGAGKSTIVSMLCGLLSMSSGDVMMYGLSLKTELVRIREITGICMQENTLFSDLTVFEHLEFLGAVKGLSGGSLGSEITSLIEEVGLSDKKYTRAKHLSGGMQRKLCLSMALLGDPKFVLLDEPSSGMDPYSRRSMWKLLQRKKHGRVMLLTTHYLDEAEVLADRVAILSKGKLVCAGSTLFLKTRYRTGYMLSVSTGIGASSTQASFSAMIHASVTGIIPNIKLVNSTPSSLVFHLPADSSETFPALFQMLNRLSSSQLVSYGLSSASLDQVLMNIVDNAPNAATVPVANVSAAARWSDSTANSVLERESSLIGESWYSPIISSTGCLQHDLSLPSNASTRSIGGSFDSTSTGVSASVGCSAAAVVHDSPPLAVGFSLWTMKLRTLLYKRFLLYRHDLRLMIMQVLIPSLLLLFTLVILNVAVNPNQLSLLLSSTSYERYVRRTPTYFLGRRDSTQKNLTIPGANLGATNYSNSSILSTFLLDESSYRSNRYGALISLDTVPVNITVNISWVKENPSFLTLLSLLPITFGPGELRYQLLSASNTSYRKCNGLTDMRDEHFFKKQGWTECLQYNVGVISLFYFLSVNQSIMHNSSSYHGLAIVNSDVTRLHLNRCFGSKFRSISYDVYNHPLPASPRQEFQTQITLSLLTCFFILIPLCYIPSSYVILLVEERINKSRQVQYLSGVSPFQYWITALLWDFMLFLIPIASFITGLFIFKSSNAKLFASNISIVLYLLLAYAFSSLPFSYILSFFYDDPSAAILGVLSVHLTVGFGLTLVYFILISEPMLTPVAGSVVHLFRLSPAFNLGEGLINYCTAYYLNELRGKEIDFYSWDVIGRNVSFMLVEGVGYFGILVLLDSHVWYWLVYLYNAALKRIFPVGGEERKDYGNYVGYNDSNGDITNRVQEAAEESIVVGDSGVAREKRLIEETMSRARDGTESLATVTSEFVLIIHNLTKQYSSVLNWINKLVYNQSSPMALDGLSLALRRGERFGLLGVNGAGKTTTFGILTGEVCASSGMVVINGRQFPNEASSLGMVGYCPQVDPLFLALTAVEVLSFYGSLKGIHCESVLRRVISLIRLIGLGDCADRPCREYSGGNKRKLSLAIAMIGRPDILLLDEPSCGMDPISRRQMWDAVNSLTSISPCTVLLVSHSIEEVEALCSRVAVLISGQVRCLGTLQELKERYNGGYEITINCVPSHMEDCLSHCTEMLQTEQAQENHIEVKEQHCGHIRMNILGEIDLEKSFIGLERCRVLGRLREYSISQCSFDSVFSSVVEAEEIVGERKAQRENNLGGNECINQFHPFSISAEGLDE